MILEIKPEYKVADIQYQFNDNFPFLMLGFIIPGQSRRKSQVHVTEFTSGARTIGECQNSYLSGMLEIDEMMSVSEVEKLFKERFNLLVLIFRKSGNQWLETTMTHSWPLQKQNDHGREITLAAEHL